MKAEPISISFYLLYIEFNFLHLHDQVILMLVNVMMIFKDMPEIVFVTKWHFCASKINFHHPALLGKFY